VSKFNILLDVAEKKNAEENIWAEGSKLMEK
jgi:hypothetical protein